MLRGREQEPDEPQGAPEWMVTFSDCMTLLLTFFVLLLSFSSFDDKAFRRMGSALSAGLPSVGTSISWDRDAFLDMEKIKYKKEVDKGSEKPTLDEENEGILEEQANPPNLHNRKVFLTSSDKVFWGRGTLISFKGREILSDMASFLETVPNKIIISENGQINQKAEPNSRDIGLQRAWAVMNYLTVKQGLDRKRFSISAVSTVPLRTLSPMARRSGHESRATSYEWSDRMLEIVILERSICN